MPGAGGEPGVWLRLELARDALGCLDARAPTERQIRLLEQSLTLEQARITDLDAQRAALETALDRSSHARDILERQLIRARHARLYWGLVGLTLGVALTSATFLALEIHR